MPQTDTPTFSLDGEPLDEGGADVGTAAEQLLDQMPEPTGLASEETAGNSSPDVDAKTDKFGTPFDPALHTGSLLKSGKWRERKTRKPVNDPRKPVTIANESGDVINEAELKLAAESAAASIFMLGMIAGGEEWQPVGDDEKIDPINERKMMTQAFEDWFRARGITKIPPATSLMLALGGYIVPRLFMPKTKARVRSVKTWVALRLTKWKLKREYKKRGIVASITIQDGEILINGTRPNSGNDGERKDDARAAAGSKVSERGA